MRRAERPSTSSAHGNEHMVREHKRNQWYPSLNGHKQIVIEEHAASNPTEIWQLIDPHGNVFNESRDRLEIDIALDVKGYAARAEGWHVASTWRSAFASPKRRHKLSLLEDRHPPKKQTGLCVKSTACEAPDTEEGVVCSGCGKEYGRHPEWWAEPA